MADRDQANDRLPAEKQAGDLQGQADRPESPGLRWPWLLSDRGIFTVAATVAGLGIVGLIGMWLIANRLHGADRAQLEIDAIKYGLGFIAAGGAAAALLLSVRRQQLSERSHQLELSKQDHELRKQTHLEADAADRRVTELYTKAVEQLGSTDAAVRLGGLYALERVAENNPGQRQTIVNVICAYLRMPYTPPAEPTKNTHPAGVAATATDAGAASGRDRRQELQVRLTAQRILTAHLRRPDDIPTADLKGMEANPRQQFWPRIDLDLTGATLVDWTLIRAAIRSARFGGATFMGEAWFRGATFTENAEFGGATFTGDALFEGATFTGDAWFEGATFTMDARFNGATFTVNAWFNAATFTGTAEFGSATFAWTAEFGGATFAGNVWFHRATFYGTAKFDEATHRDGLGSMGFGSCRIVNRDGRHDRWPAGWSVVPGTEYSTLRYQLSEA
ncbi:pentapeptide repeat-containing protein [Paractinoplanes toevensis]|uniref:Pentapeptide repeat-containing protein n=1 Tax=Paractinoplanes toevensis TaxID=571911 RepID=A0A919WBF1_9ACTN|nr:pentapeptide repeat-containing protein [Actinoplanes toevensis]GIM97129.1 hypothetical protein Ato02nite_089220 [Actinoplanes toevensis]